MNGRGTKSDLIDRVLQGRDADTKARVLDLIYRLKLEPTDELFLFCVAIGYLETIIIDAPEQWEAVFQNFKNHLEQWKSHHLRTLETSEHLTTQIEEMTQTLTEQSLHTSDLAKGLKGMARHLTNIAEPLPNWERMFKNLHTKLDDLSEEQSRLLRREIQRLNETLLTIQPLPTTTNNISLKPPRITPIPSLMNGETPSPRPTGSRAASVLLALILGVSVFTCYLVVDQRKTLNWLLYKANRQDCKQRILAPKSPQCAQFQ